MTRHGNSHGGCRPAESNHPHIRANSDNGSLAGPQNSEARNQGNDFGGWEKRILREHAGKVSLFDALYFQCTLH